MPLNDNDHDLLIKISSDMDWVKNWAIKHEADDSAVHKVMDNSVKKAHERIDKVHTSVNNKFIWLVGTFLVGIVVLLFNVAVGYYQHTNGTG